MKEWKGNGVGQVDNISCITSSPSSCQDSELRTQNSGKQLPIMRHGRLLSWRFLFFWLWLFLCHIRTVPCNARHRILHFSSPALLSPSLLSPPFAPCLHSQSTLFMSISEMLHRFNMPTITEETARVTMHPLCHCSRPKSLSCASHCKENILSVRTPYSDSVPLTTNVVACRLCSLPYPFSLLPFGFASLLPSTLQPSYFHQ